MAPPKAIPSTGVEKKKSPFDYSKKNEKKKKKNKKKKARGWGPTVYFEG